MSNVPAELRYTKDHEWVKPDGETATVGITGHAQESLGDITYLELPEAGSRFEAGETFGVVESVKAASDLYMPVSGEVVATNDKLADTPEKINEDPYGEGWMVRIKPDDPSSIDSLLSADDYAALL